MMEIPAEVLRVSIACNKSGGCRIVLPEHVEEILADHDHPDNPWRLYRATGWEPVLAPELIVLAGEAWTRGAPAEWSTADGALAGACLAAALEELRLVRTRA